MNGAWFALALLALAALLAWRKPILARLGAQQAFRRPRQTAVIALGLMFATVVVGASAIAADSTRVSFQEAILGRAPGTDAILYDVFQRGATLRSDLEAAPDRVPVLAGHVADRASALSYRLPFDDDRTGLGQKDALALGIEPASWRRLTGLAAESGSIPSSSPAWPDGGVVLTRAMAARLDAQVGDDVTLYAPVRSLLVANTTLRAGHLNVSLASPTPGVGPPYLTGPNDVTTFTFPLREASRIEVAADTDQPFELHLYAPLVSGSRNVTGGSHPRLLVDYGVGILDGNLTVEVTSPAAANLDFTLTVNITATQELPPAELPGKVVAIAQDGGGDPLNGYPALMVERARLQRFLGLGDQASMLLLKLEPGFRVSPIRDQAQAALPTGLYLVAPREQLEAQAAEIDLATRSFFLGMGSFTIAAGMMLIVVLLALLVEERKGMLGALRAVGAQRRALTRLHFHEGLVYAALAASLGLLGAIALAAVMGSTVSGIFSDTNVHFRLVLQPASLASALGFGFTLTMLALVVAAHRAVRIDVPAALRGEESASRPRRWPAVTATVLGALLSLAGILGREPITLVAGPVLLGIGAAGLAPHRRRNLAVSLAALAVTAYLASTFAFMKVDAEVEAILVPVRGMLLAIAASVLCAYSSALHAVVVAAARLVPRAGAIVETALSHLRRRPGRAALTMAMLSTVLLVMTALGTLFATASPREYGATGGYGVIGESEESFDDPHAYYDAHKPRSGADPFPHVGDLLVLPLAKSALFRFGGPNLTLNSRAGTLGRDVVAMTSATALGLDYQASQRMPQFPDAHAALAALATRTDLVVLSDAVYGYGDGKTVQVHAGQSLALRSSGETRTVVVAAILDNVGSVGAFVNPALLAQVDAHPGTRLYVKAQGASDHQVAQELEAGFRRAGMTATAVADDKGREQEAVAALQALVGVFLALGILVGLVSLGLVTARNVLVRRREAGMLRAVGAQRGQVAALFAIESVYLTAMACLIGLGGGLLLAFSVLALDDFITFRIDWASIALLDVATLAAAAATAIVPSWRAARIPPAQAIRYVE